MATNVGRTFLKILDEEFPDNHVFRKIFNRNTVKISYSCMPNLKQKIDGSNKSILQKTTAAPVLKACNCRRPADCPMTGDCLKSSVVYQATMTTEDSSQPKLMWGSPRPRLRRDLPITNLLSTTPAAGSVQSSVNMFRIWRRQTWSSRSLGKFQNKPLPLALSWTAVICVCGRNISLFVDRN